MIPDYRLAAATTIRSLMLKKGGHHLPIAFHMRARFGCFFCSERSSSAMPAATQPTPRPQKNLESGA